jgi:hypothetical protein
MAISQTQIASTSLTGIYTSSNDSAVTAIYICNTSPATIHFNLLVVPVGNEPSEQFHTIYKNVSLTSTDTYVIDTERLILANGDSIHVGVPDYVSDNIIVTASYIGI